MGRTPLITMGYWGFEAVLHELLAAGADVNAADKVPAHAADATARDGLESMRWIRHADNALHAFRG